MVAFAMRSATSLEVPELNPRAMVDFWESLYAGMGVTPAWRGGGFT